MERHRSIREDLQAAPQSWIADGSSCAKVPRKREAFCILHFGLNLRGGPRRSKCKMQKSKWKNEGRSTSFDPEPPTQPPTPNPPPPSTHHGPQPRLDGLQQIAARGLAVSLLGDRDGFADFNHRGERPVNAGPVGKVFLKPLHRLQNAFGRGVV